MTVSPETVAMVKALRADGLSFRDIDAAMDRPATNGNWSWKLLRGVPIATTKDLGERLSISLWKAAEGGRSFKAIEATLAAAGISCSKGDPSEFEGRYDVFVRAEDFADAQRLLLVDVDGISVQALDDLRDATR